MQPAAVVLLVVHPEVLAAVRAGFLQVVGGVDGGDGVRHRVVLVETLCCYVDTGVLLASTRRLVQPHATVLLEALRLHGQTVSIQDIEHQWDS